jgi:hypothetical protein
MVSNLAPFLFATGGAIPVSREDEVAMPNPISPPTKRVLRGYSIDPSLALSLSTLPIHEIRYEVDWEPLSPHPLPPVEKLLYQENSAGVSLSVGSYPQGEYLEIVDIDPASQLYYEPVNLDHPHLLAQDGYPPDVGNPQFHQQMVYAVMMTTIRNFERALGRRIQWGERIPQHRQTEPDNDGQEDPSGTNESRAVLNFQFVKRLRVYPHALRQANAFYDPQRKSLLFGYFRSTPSDPKLQLPGTTVFTCLSHDIIAHETTHAILDGLHRRYIHPTHPDTRAFHEAFADIVALFQHFTFPEVLRHQIALTRGDLLQQNLLGQLAQEFGRAMGGYGGLRDALGGFDENHQWRPKIPNPDDYRTVMECHARGAILVAAVFDAFLNVYRGRIKKLLRIATGGTGILPQGELHPDLVDELANNAADTARTVLRICIRALDYSPPVDLTFGDYLRALITADCDMVDNDRLGYRVAFVEAFQKRGISVPEIHSMAVDSLRHPRLDNPLKGERRTLLGNFLREVKSRIAYAPDRESLYWATRNVVNGIGPEGDTSQEPTDPTQQGKNKNLQSLLQSFLTTNEVDSRQWQELTGLMFPGPTGGSSEEIQKACEKSGLEYGYLTENCASYVIDKLWLANRAGPDGRILDHVIVNLVQKRGVTFKKSDTGDWAVDETGFFVDDNTHKSSPPIEHIIFRGGCTLVFDLETQQLRYVIKKDVNDYHRMVRQFLFERDDSGSMNLSYFQARELENLSGPFAFMHSHHSPGEHSHG